MLGFERLAPALLPSQWPSRLSDEISEDVMGFSADALQCYLPTTAALARTGKGPLTGSSVAVKDLFSVAGHTSSFGHAQWRSTHAPARQHAKVISQLRRAGATVTGLAKMDQLAYSLIGNDGEGKAPVNPFDSECYCGGSSSGSASAVAGGVADVGLGTDTAGSIRVPAAACGLFSLRPTHGRIDTDGVIPLAPSFDVVGLMARRPELLTTAGTVLGLAVQASRRPRRVLLATASFEHLDSAAQEALTEVAQRVGEIVDGAVTEVPAATLVTADVGDLFARLQGREIWQQHGAWVSENGSHLADDVQTRLQRCKALNEDPDETKSADKEARLAYTDQFQDLIGEDGLLILPVVPRRGPLRSWTPEELLTYRTECFRLTAPSSLTGAPEVVMPISTGNAGRIVPAGLVGWRDSDHLLLSVAERLANGSERVAL